MVPNPAVLVRWDEFMWKEMREGGVLKHYLERERHTAPKRRRAVGRQMMGFDNKRHATNKADWELKAAVPAREFFRWKKVDKDFWMDDKNLRSLKRDNPEMCIYNVK